MRFAAAAALKDIRRRVADPVALVVWIGIPLAIGSLMNVVIGGIGSAPPRARVLVADQDGTVLSRLLSGSGGPQSAFGEFVDVEQVTLGDGRRRIDAGEGTALLVIRARFQEAVLDDKPAELQLITNPGQRILPGIVRERVEVLVEGIFYVQRLFAAEARALSRSLAGGAVPSDADLAAISTGIGARMRELEGTLLPPAITLEVLEEQRRPGVRPNFGQLFFPGILLMSMLFIAQGMSLDIWQEKTRGTLRRVLTTSQPVGALLAGKLLAGAALIAVVVSVALFASVWLFGVAWWRLPLAAAWCIVAGTALLAMLTLLQVQATSERGGQLLSMLVIFPLIMAGGSFFPFETMPAWMAEIGRRTPNGLAVVRLKEILFGDPDVRTLSASLLAIAVPAVAAGVLTVRRLRGRFATG
ncbi:MAG TPA: ABC transporter permease [Vicinamibacterales bacterium]|nr:ABC transporter permease [Vicinamibacterales bacterium]